MADSLGAFGPCRCASSRGFADHGPPSLSSTTTNLHPHTNGNPLAYTNGDANNNANEYAHSLAYAYPYDHTNAICHTHSVGSLDTTSDQIFAPGGTTE
jgi:hypothetical protein